MEKYKNEKLPIDERVNDLVSRMTVEECASQMIFNAKKVERINIKEYNWWNEALHGVARCGMATVFPQAIGMAATFDDVLIQRVSDVISTEGRAKFNMYQKYHDYGIYKGITFWSPNVNIFRDPRWGRGQETYGEDPYLTSKLGVAFVKGLQGNHEKYLKSAACAKHYAVHSGPEKLRHEFNAIASKKDMNETYLPAFKELVNCGVEGFMGAYNRTNGEPCCGSKTLLQDILRDEWGFDGYITSDCWAIADFHMHHHVTNSKLESVALALNAGCDLNCGNMYEYMLKAYENGMVSEEKIRKSTRRLMKTRMKLGMFDDKTPFDHLGLEQVDCQEHREINEDVARKSLVLLKNDGLLPLNTKDIKKILVTGPNSNSIVALEGNYHGTANQYHTILESIRKRFTDSITWYSEGAHLYEHKLEDPGYDGDRLAEVRAMSDEADVVIVVTGLDETIEGEEMVDKDISGDKETLYLPKSQRELVRALCERKTPVIIVNLSGSSIDFEYGNEHAAAIIQAWYPGAMGGEAVADLIIGEYSPSGRLPVTFYKEDNWLPDFSDYSMDGRTYKFINEEPLFPFGFGLSYTTMMYSQLKISKLQVSESDIISGSVKVMNNGHFASDEIVQIYLKDKDARVRVPHHKLCFFRRIYLEPQQEIVVDFEIDTEELMIISEDGERTYEKGDFQIFAGGSQPDTYSQRLSNSNIVSTDFKLI